MTDIETMYADLDSHHIEGIAHQGNTPFSVPLISHIEGNLWTGGCVDGVRLPDDFRYVVSLYPWEKYQLGPGTVRQETPLYDEGAIPNTELLEELSRLVNDYRADGKTLVHSQAGLNRSSLVAALSLIRFGHEPAAAVTLLRERRSPAVLCNQSFERWLLSPGASA